VKTTAPRVHRNRSRAAAELIECKDRSVLILFEIGGTGILPVQAGKRAESPIRFQTMPMPTVSWVRSVLIHCGVQITFLLRLFVDE
jgi:hypothetical protein